MEKYYLIIILTTVGFFLLAAILLVPIWRFLKREEDKARDWSRSCTDPHSDGDDAHPNANGSSSRYGDQQS